MRATNAQFEAMDILNRLDVRLLDLSPGDKGWDVFSLHYHVDGPISTVSPSRVQSRSQAAWELRSFGQSRSQATWELRSCVQCRSATWE